MYSVLHSHCRIQKSKGYTCSKLCDVITGSSNHKLLKCIKYYREMYSVFQQLMKTRFVTVKQNKLQYNFQL